MFKKQENTLGPGIYAKLGALIESRTQFSKVKAWCPNPIDDEGKTGSGNRIRTGDNWIMSPAL